MTLDQFIIRLSGWLTVASNLIVLAAAIWFLFRRRPRLSVILIGISAGLGASRAAVFWTAQSWGQTVWNILNVLFGLDLVFWTIGVCLLFREIAKYEKADSYQAAADKAGIASRLTINRHWPGLPEPGCSASALV